MAEEEKKIEEPVTVDKTEVSPQKEADPVESLLPHTTDFQPNPEGGNATKVEIDMEKNAPFIAELKQKIEACTDPEAAKKMVEEFEKTTGMSFDKALELAGKKVTVIVDGENGEQIVKKADRDSEDAKNGTIVDDPENPKAEIDPETEEEKKEKLPDIKFDDPNDKKKYDDLPYEAQLDYQRHLEEYNEEERKAYLDKLFKATRSTRNINFNEDPAPQKTADEALVDSANDSKVVETEDDDPELTSAVNEKLEDAYKDPSSLKFTEEEILDIIKLGVIGDEEAARALANSFNSDIDEIIKGAEDPDSRYHDEEARKKAIYDSLAVKVSLEQSVKAANEITDPAFIQEIFKVKYPKYVERGPASVIEEFTSYLENRTRNQDSIDFLNHELVSKKKVDQIINRADKEIFRFVQTRNNVRYDVKAFLVNSFNMHKRYIAEVYGFTPEEMPKFTMKTCESVMTIYLILFLRFVYKKMCPEFATHKMQRKYFVEFIADMSRPATSLTPEKRQYLDEAERALWNKIFAIEADLIKYEDAHGLNGTPKKN